jgi:hypothetical protein
VKKTLIGMLALAAAAGTASAASVNVAGGASGSGSNTPVLGLNSITALPFTASGAGVTVNGLVQGGNSVVGDTQLFTLVLTNFNFTSTNQGTTTITVTVSQDYDIGAPGSSATGSHQYNGNTTGTRSGSISVASTHESTALPVIGENFSGTQNIGAQQGATIGVPIAGSVYSIVATYTFTINGGAGSGSIILPDSGVDNATLVLVPLPPAAYAGMGGLALAGFAAFRRRGQNRA